MLLRTCLRLGVGAMLVGCAALGGAELAERYGESHPRSRVVAELTPGEVDYWRQVKPVLESRCAVCHGCYDAPCQLKLDSIEGVERGATTERVYDTSRLKASEPTRLFVDAQTPAEWRERGFHPVLNERADVPEANRELSLLYRVLEQKRRKPFTPDEIGVFDFTLDRPETCPTAEAYDEFAAAHPLLGMPYALPELTPEEQAVVMRWVEEGSPYQARPPLPAREQRAVATWEAFLNGDSAKQQLMSRYIYEHLFLAHLYFAEPSDGEPPPFFELVRSKTPPGEPIAIVATRRPYDDPGVSRVYYRLRPVLGAILDKTHMPYRIDEARMRRWRELFLAPDYEVTKLPAYDVETTSNPFVVFHELPIHTRYAFMLDEAEFTIMGFIKGPVCRGQVALNVVDDHFWVFFMDPDLPVQRGQSELLEQEASNLDLPAEEGSSVVRIVKYWHEYRKREESFLEAKARFVQEHMVERRLLDERIIWDGAGSNANAALTVFRHFDSATVAKGLLGGSPKTAWVITYPLLERIHYLLVAGYDVYGNVGHQLLSRIYMDFLRMEGESNFLYFLPADVREREIAYWYRGAPKEALDFIELQQPEFEGDPAIHFETDDPKTEFLSMLGRRLAPALESTRYRTLAGARPAAMALWQRLEATRGRALSQLPECSFVAVRLADGRTARFTLLLDRARSNLSTIFEEKDTLLPDEDTLSVVPGLIGAYPNALFAVDERDLPDFVRQIEQLQQRADFDALARRYAVKRWDPTFWDYSDRLHADHRAADPVHAGLFDFNRLGSL
jgi:fatty acid cis/trans isomerase CTI